MQSDGTKGPVVIPIVGDRGYRGPPGPAGPRVSIIHSIN